jgi:Ni,Fe-hydrogenase I large subunit
MSDWIGLGIIVLVLAGALVGLSQLGKPAKALSQEEYERRVSESRGYMSAGVMAGLYALQKLLNPKAVEAIEVQRDLKAGFYNDEEKDAGPDEAGRTKTELKPTDEGETDA